jgi:hypothetical protein
MARVPKPLKPNGAFIVFEPVWHDGKLNRAIARILKSNAFLVQLANRGSTPWCSTYVAGREALGVVGASELRFATTGNLRQKNQRQILLWHRIRPTRSTASQRDNQARRSGRQRRHIYGLANRSSPQNPLDRRSLHPCEAFLEFAKFLPPLELSRFRLGRSNFKPLRIEITTHRHCFWIATIVPAVSSTRFISGFSRKMDSIARKTPGYTGPIAS